MHALVVCNEGEIQDRAAHLRGDVLMGRDLDVLARGLTALAEEFADARESVAPVGQAPDTLHVINATE